MLLRKMHGGASVAGYAWADDGDVVDVPDELGLDLLALDPAEYEHVPDDSHDVDPNGGEVKQPNQAASAEDWKAYALAQGLPGDVVEAASRKAIVGHFNGGDPLVEQE
jgi:hypothetical protein